MRNIKIRFFVSIVVILNVLGAHCAFGMGAWVRSNAKAAWNIAQQRPFFVCGTGLLCVAGIKYSVAQKTQSTKPVKQVASFYESKDPNAQLVVEPVEWPVKVVYADNIIGRIMSRCASILGGWVTGREGRLKNTPALTARYLEHYLSFYQDHINMDEYNIPEEGFTTFNDWFIRTLKNPTLHRPLEDHVHAIASPADSKVLIIPNLSLHTQVTIKERQFDLAKFLGNAQLAQGYEHGVMMIFRLSPYNYHRYHYPFDCMVGQEYCIDGKYHSVNPRAFVAGVQPLTENKRSYQLLTPSNGSSKVVMVQVGATAVASIVNHFMDYSTGEPTVKADFEGRALEKGSETGYFQFGGSTVVLLFPKGAMVPDPQIVKNSLNGYETAVKVRETIAYWQDI